MRELIVISGKGGTGKTSITGALASLANKATLVDCDVDAADLHLIIDHSVSKETDFIGGKQASINEQRCTNCGVCVEYCRFDAIKYSLHQQNENNKRYWIDKYTCDGCGVCVRHCPENAIDFNEVISGKWYLSHTQDSSFLHAQLGIAQANSGKLVSLLRQQARIEAEKYNSNLILVDGPPGIGCPVIASITGASYVLIVTEPSLSALHDMERLVKLTNHFNVPVGICINKFDINTDISKKIKEFSQNKNIKKLGRIPYDLTVTEAQLAGTTIVNHESEKLSKEILELWENLEEEMKLKQNFKV